MQGSYPNTNDALSMILKMYGDTSRIHMQRINELHTQNKRLNKEKIENDDFFMRLIALLVQVKPINLKEQLIAISKEQGYVDLASALNLARNKEGQSFLEHAFQQQNFTLATLLMNLGALVGPIERAVFEVAIDSQAAREFGFTTKPFEGKELHTVKNFGLVLGIKMTSQDGTHSQYAHIAPTYQLMTDSVAEYSSKNPDNKHFQAIADAFSFSNKAGAFSYSTSQRNPKAGEEMASRIQSGKVTSIPIGCKGHVMGLSIVPDGPNSNAGYLVYTNRGVGSNPGNYGTHIYRINDLKKVDSSFINSVMNGLGEGASYEEMMRKIDKVTEGKAPVHSIEQGGQKNDNCTIANPRSNIHGIRLCQEAIAKKGFDKLSEKDMASIKAEFKEYTTFMRTQKIHELAKALEKNPKDADLNNLAKEYINQHKDAPSSLKAPLEKALHLVMNQETQSLQRTFKSKL